MPKSRHRGVRASTEKYRARVFWSGRSQAIRLPKELRVSTTEVAITREGHRLVVEPIEMERDAKGWPLAWWDLAGSAPEFAVGRRDTPHERGDVFATGGF